GSGPAAVAVRAGGEARGVPGAPEAEGGGIAHDPERTLAWPSRYRRLSKDYEYLPETSEAMIYAAVTRAMRGRLPRPTRAAAAAGAGPHTPSEGIALLLA